MWGSLKGRGLITTQEWSREELDRTIKLATELKEKQKRGIPHRLLEGKTLHMHACMPDKGWGGREGCR